MTAVLLQLMLVPPPAAPGRIDVVAERRPGAHHRRSASWAQLCAFGRRAHGIVAFAGELDAATGPRLEQYLATEPGPTRLDLGAVTFMDTSGFETLQRVQQRCRVNGWSFTIERSSPAVDRILQLIGVGHDLVDHQTADEPVRPQRGDAPVGSVLSGGSGPGSDAPA